MIYPGWVSTLGMYEDIDVYHLPAKIALAYRRDEVTCPLAYEAKV